MDSYTITCFIERSEKDLDTIEEQITDTGYLSNDNQKKVLKYKKKMRYELDTFKDNIEEIDEEEDEE